MSPMRRFTLALLFLIALAHFASPAALAQEGDWGTIVLTNTGAEPSARGEATLTGVTFDGWSWNPPNEPWWGEAWVEEYSGDLSMTCQGLKPRALYQTTVGELKAGRDGTLQAAKRVGFVFAWRFDDQWGNWYLSGNRFVVSVARAGGKRAVVLSGAYYLHEYAWPHPW